MSKQSGPGAPTAAEFAQTLGHVTWLATQSTGHRDLPIAALEAKVLAPLMFKQVRIYFKDKQPLAAIVWALVSPEVKSKLSNAKYVMQLPDWRSGPEVVIVDCVSPYTDPKKFKQLFMAEANASRTPSEGSK